MRLTELGEAAQAYYGSEIHHATKELDRVNVRLADTSGQLSYQADMALKEFLEQEIAGFKRKVR